MGSLLWGGEGGFLIGLFLIERWANLDESTIALTAGLILVTVNIIRLFKGFRLHYFSLALGLISLGHGAAYFLDQPFPFWPLVGGAVLLYGVAKLLLRDRIR